jgi:hypothetical protein
MTAHFSGGFLITGPTPNVLARTQAVLAELPSRKHCEWAMHAYRESSRFDYSQAVIITGKKDIEAAHKVDAEGGPFEQLYGFLRQQGIFVYQKPRSKVSGERLLNITV